MERRNFQEIYFSENNDEATITRRRAGLALVFRVRKSSGFSETDFSDYKLVCSMKIWGPPKVADPCQAKDAV